MVKEEFYRVCGFIQVELIDRSECRSDWKVEAVEISNCGGIELHLSPKSIIWESEVVLLISYCQLHCLCVETRMDEGKFIIR